MVKFHLTNKLVRDEDLLRLCSRNRHWRTSRDLRRHVGLLLTRYTISGGTLLVAISYATHRPVSSVADGSYWVLLQDRSNIVHRDMDSIGYSRD